MLDQEKTQNTCTSNFSIKGNLQKQAIGKCILSANQSMVIRLNRALPALTAIALTNCSYLLNFQPLTTNNTASIQSIRQPFPTNQKRTKHFELKIPAFSITPGIYRLSISIIHEHSTSSPTLVLFEEIAIIQITPHDAYKRTIH